MGQLDASIVTVALPTLSRQLGAPLGEVEWVALSYILVLVAAILVVGRIADRTGRRTLYITGFVVFVAGSAGCAAAPGLALLVAARVVQGLGAVLLQANSVALIRDALPADRIGAGIGVQGAAQAVGLAAGPSVGGALIALGGWRPIFLINVPVGVIGIAAAAALLPPGRRPAPGTPRIDLLGAALVALTAATAVAALSLVAVPGKPAAGVGLLGAAALLSGAGAWLWQRHRPGALLEADLLGRRPFLTGLFAALLGYSTLFGVLLLVPFLLETSGGSPVRAGLELTLLPLALGAVAPAGGRLADRRGARGPGVAGMVLVAAGLTMLAAAPQLTALRLIALLLMGSGQGLFVPAINASIMRAAPPQRTGGAAGALNLVRGLGTAIGIAVGGVALAVSGPRAGFGFLAVCAGGAGLIAAVRRPARAPR